MNIWFLSIIDLIVNSYTSQVSIISVSSSEENAK
jgi:hypothetical protein